MPTMTIEQMDEQHDKLTAVEEAVTLPEFEQEAGDEEFPGLDLYNTLVEAVDLMKRCAIFFDYASDKVLTQSLTNSHRNIMIRLSNGIHDFTGAVEQSLAAIDEESE